MAVTALKFVDETEASEALYTDYIKALLDAYRQGLGDIVTQLEKMYKLYGSADGRLDAQTLARMDQGAKNKVTRLQAMQEKFADRVEALNAGQPQELEAHLAKVYGINYDGGAEKIRMATSFDMVNERAVEEAFTREYAKIALQDNATFVRSKIREQITQGVLQGDPIEKMAKRIQGVLEQNLNNTVRIARTETTGIMGQARQDLFDDAEDKGMTVLKQWLATSDSRTRPSHQAINGQKRECDDVFDNGLRFPSDPLGSAGEVINCRCTMTGTVLHEGEVFTKETVDVEKAKRDATQAKKDEAMRKRAEIKSIRASAVSKKKAVKGPKLTGQEEHKIPLFQLRPLNAKGERLYTDFDGIFSPKSNLDGFEQIWMNQNKDRMVQLAQEYPIPKLGMVRVATVYNDDIFGSAGFDFPQVYSIVDKNDGKGPQAVVQFGFDYQFLLSRKGLRSEADADVAMNNTYIFQRKLKAEQADIVDYTFLTVDHEYAHLIDNAYKETLTPYLDRFTAYGSQPPMSAGANETNVFVEKVRNDMIQVFNSPSMSSRILETFAKEANEERIWVQNEAPKYFTEAEVAMIRAFSPYTIEAKGTGIYAYKTIESLVANNFGQYANTSPAEFMAEAFAVTRNISYGGVNEDAYTPMQERFTQLFEEYYEEVLGSGTPSK
jgi:SPP1 gp7 family putative phage head morphogenesis protein